MKFLVIILLSLATLIAARNYEQPRTVNFQAAVVTKNHTEPASAKKSAELEVARKHKIFFPLLFGTKN